MADFKTASTVGARIAAIRKARGFVSAKALAETIPGESITDSILRNIEAGRKNDLAVAQLLNLAWALRVSPLFILAPLGSPDERLDLPNIIPEVQDLTTGEFDAWVSGDTTGIYRPVTTDEMSERIQLEALHELLRTRREVTRLGTMMTLKAELPESLAGESGALRWNDTEQQLAAAQRRIVELETLLASGGWQIGSSED
ncbi:hypothetical protein BH11ACT2_BH11ACT2_03370 [soil metagenome]